MRLLIIEDEEPIITVVKKGMQEEGFCIDTARDGISGLQAAIESEYDVIILDIMLPGMDGWRVCEELRSQRINTPILMLTALDTVSDRVRGLEIGADDYLPKPFDFSELLARVRALHRRDKVHKERILRIAHLQIDTTARTVTCAGQDVALTPREYSLLEAMVLNEGRILSRDTIQYRIWNDDDSYSNTVDVHIATLRKKIEAGQDAKLIHTVHGLGYVLRRPETEVQR
ncbi:MAG: response regulator transcription factor [Armatimonadota bacterium]